MTLHAWYTQPPPLSKTDTGNFSSFYMYDTDTKRFSRIRLQLGRNNPSSSNNNEANVGFNADRAVGFSKTSLPSRAKGGDWSVNDKFELCFDKTPLQGPPPSPGQRTYDVTVVTSTSGAKTLSGFHPGNAVTDKPKLPTGINEDHLALMAQDALITGQTRTLSAGTASESVLVKAIQDEVVRITGAKDFGAVNDDVIRITLEQQAKRIASEASSDSVGATEEALVSAEKVESMVIEKISQGTVPTPELEAEMSELEKDITSAKTSISGGDVEKALTQIGSAEKAVTTAIQEDSASDDVSMSDLESVEESVNLAKAQATTAQKVEDGYNEFSDAESVDGYMSDLS